MALSSYDIRFILSVSDRTGNSLRRVAGDMRGMTTDAARMRKAFAAMDVGRGLQLRGLLAGAGLGVAAQQAADFATSVTKAASQIAGDNNVQQIAANTTKLQNEILDLMGQFPAKAQEQADAAYDIFSSMNVPLQEGVGLLKLFNMVSVAGATDLETATNAMITILNNFGGSWQQTMKAVNTSFAIIRFGRLEFAEFNEMLNQVIPAAKAAGQSLEDVSGAMAFMTTRVPSQRQGATAIARLLEVVSRPDFRNGAKKLGLEIEDMTGRLKPLPEIIEELARLDISKVESTIGSLIPVVTATGRGGGRGIQSTIQARKALILMIKDLKGYREAQDEVTSATREFEKRYTVMIGSAGVKWEKFKAQLQAILIIVGSAAIPMFEKLADTLQRGMDWAKNNRGTLEFIVKGTLAVAVASLLAGTFLKLYGALLVVYTGFLRLGRIMAIGAIAARATAAIGFLSAAFSLLAANGLKALPVILMNLRVMQRLALLAKAGAIIFTVIVLWEVHKKRGWNEFWKDIDEKIVGAGKAMQKTGVPVVSGVGVGLQAIGGLDRKVRVQNLEELKKNAKSGKGSNQEISKVVKSNYQQMIDNIKRDLKGLSGDLFTNKMFKDMGLDAQSINDQVNALINQPPGAADKKRTAQEIVSRTKDLLKQASDNLINIYNEFKEANKQAFGSIFEPLQGEGEEQQLRKAWNWTAGSEDLLATMKARLAQFRKWRNGLDTLLKKGFSSDFVQELRELGPEGAMKFLTGPNSLLKAGPNRVREFNRVMAAGKGAITKATEIDFNKQLDKWNQFGKNTAFKIIAGLESEEQTLQKRMVGVVERLYSGVARAIAEQQVKLEFAVPDEVTVNFGVSPKVKPKTEPKGPTAADIRTRGYEGKYAIPAAMALRSGTPFGSLGGIPAWAIAALAAGPGGVTMPQVASDAARNRPGVINFNVNGNFLTPKEMMDAALNQSAHKLRNTR